MTAIRRLAIVIDGLSGIGGGISTYLDALLPGLASRGIDATLVAGQPPEQAHTTPYIHVPGVEADRRSLPDETADELAATLAQIAPDVCFTHVVSPHATRIASRAAPTVFYAHEFLTVCPGGARHLQRSERFCSEGPGARCFWRAYTERTTNRRPDRLVHAYARVRGWRDTWSSLSGLLVASPRVAEILSAEGAPRDLIDVVPYPVLPTVSARTRPTDVVYLGRLIVEKGVHILLEALRDLPEVTAVIAGDGPSRVDLERLSRSLGLEDRVQFVGWVDPDERGVLLNGARVLAVPSLWEEAFGITGVEALAAGVPVVASETGGIPSWLTDDEGGLLVPSGDRRALTGALRRILDDPSLHARLSRQGPVVAAAYSLDRHLDGLIDAFERATQGPSQRAGLNS